MPHLGRPAARADGDPSYGRRRLSRVLVAGTALAAGTLFAASATTAQGTDLRAGRRVQLTDLIASQRRDVAVQEQDVARVRAEVQAGTARVGARDVRVAAERRRADALAAAAGTTPVHGPAVTVGLDDAPRSSTSDNPDDLVVHQQDVQAVVNALWAGGAEAMTLMGQRVISTSAVRCVGNTVVLHGQVYGPPFVVSAVGDQQGMRQALDREPGVQLFRRYVDRFGLGYTVTQQRDLRVPAYEGALDLPSVSGPG